MSRPTHVENVATCAAYDERLRIREAVEAKIKEIERLEDTSEGPVRTAFSLTAAAFREVLELLDERD